MLVRGHACSCGRVHINYGLSSAEEMSLQNPILMTRNDQVAILISGTCMIQEDQADAWCFDGRGHAQARRSVVTRQGSEQQF